MWVKNIFVYPVKSLKGIHLESSRITPRGLLNDRRYMITDAGFGHVTQREKARLALIDASPISGGIRLELPNGETKEWLHQPSGRADRKKVTVWSSTVDALIADQPTNAFLSEYLGKTVFFCYMPEDSYRQINECFNRGNEIVSFADGYPLLAITTASLENLNGRLEESVGVERFRPNIVIEGAKEFEEDSWARIRVGDSVFRVTKPCARCVVTTVDQSSGIRTGREPLKTLADFRLAKDIFPDRLDELDLNSNDVLFGTNLVPESGSNIKVGDPVEVLG
ncbi:MAG: MOSC domain-containing protein [Pyrinomonadaceae bacterium]|nr:MOSC domain-containing protein [Pyrinomonadaceae bacterium]